MATVELKKDTILEQISQLYSVFELCSDPKKVDIKVETSYTFSNMIQVLEDISLSVSDFAKTYCNQISQYNNQPSQDYITMLCKLFELLSTAAKRYKEVYRDESNESAIYTLAIKALTFIRTVKSKEFMLKLNALEQDKYGALKLEYIIKLIYNVLVSEESSKEDNASSCQSLYLILYGEASQGINVVKVDDETIEGGIFRRAREYVFNFLKRDIQATQSALKVVLSYNQSDEDLKELYKTHNIQPKTPAHNIQPETLDKRVNPHSDESDLDSESIEPEVEKKIKPDAIPINVLDAIKKQNLDTIKKEQLLTELDGMKTVPKEIFIFPYITTRHGTTLDTGYIGVSADIFLYPPDVAAILLAFILLHELCHHKKNLFQRAHYDWRTPEFISHHQGGFESGELLELELFGQKPSLISLSTNTEALAILKDLQNLDENRWTNLKAMLEGRKIEPKKHHLQGDLKRDEEVSNKDCFCGVYEPRTRFSSLLAELCSDDF